MTNLIQGSDAILYFDKNGFVPVLCATDITFNHEAKLIGIRTTGDGHYEKNTYQSLNWGVQLSGLIKFDDVNWTGWDMLDNQIGFSDITMKIVFIDDQGNTRGIQGDCVVETTNFGISVSNLVKMDISLTGNGAVMVFDGPVPCATAITGITVTGQAASDGIAHFNYAYTGVINQVKYRIDGSGPYVYTLAPAQIDVPGLSIGAHSIEIIPICVNTYEGTGFIQSFTMTNTFTCSLSVSSVSSANIGAGTTLTVTLSSVLGAGAYVQYQLDGGVAVKVFPTVNPFLIRFPVLTNGAHSVLITPVCGNGVPGTPFTKTFTSSGGAAVSTINWSNTFGSAGNLTIYKNGFVVVSSNSTNSGSFTALSTDSIKSVLYGSVSGRVGTLETDDTTLSTTLDHQTFNAVSAVSFTFSPSLGDTYSITGTIT